MASHVKVPVTPQSHGRGQHCMQLLVDILTTDYSLSRQTGLDGATTPCVKTWKVAAVLAILGHCERMNCYSLERSSYSSHL